MIPKIITPRMHVNIPHIDKDIYVKPYTVGSEKSLVVSDTEDINDNIKVIYQIVKDCILDNSIDVDELTLGEFLYLFLQIQKISTKDTIDIVKKHKDHEFNVSIRYDDIKLDKSIKGFTFNVKTEDGDYIVEVDNPKMKDYMNGNKISEEGHTDNISLFISKMYKADGNDVIDLTLDDKREIVESLPLYEIQKIVEFAEKMTMPTYDIDLECPVCHEQIKESLNNFFI